MSHIKKFNESDLGSKINSIDIDSLRVDCEIDVAQSYDWEDDSRWCECENESDWVSSYGFASEKATLFYDKDHNLHNENGPAVINKNGDCEWWLNGKKHRMDGPAVSHDSDNYFEWWVDGKRHNENGPAICFANGNYSWFIDNINYSQSEFLAISRENKLKTILHESY